MYSSYISFISQVMRINMLDKIRYWKTITPINPISALVEAPKRTTKLNIPPLWYHKQTLSKQLCQTDVGREKKPNNALPENYLHPGYYLVVIENNS